MLNLRFLIGFVSSIISFMLTVDHCLSFCPFFWTFFELRLLLTALVASNFYYTSQPASSYISIYIFLNKLYFVMTKDGCFN